MHSIRMNHPPPTNLAQNRALCQSARPVNPTAGRRPVDTLALIQRIGLSGLESEMSYAPPAGPPPRRPGGPAPSASVRVFAQSEQAPVAPVALIAVSTVASWALFLAARGAGAGQSVDVDSKAIVGWVLGGIVGALLLSWFRAADMTRRSSSTYIEQSWRPALVAGALAAAGWAASIANAWLIASSVARR